MNKLLKSALTSFTVLSLLGISLSITPLQARAEMSELTVERAFGIAYLPLMLMERDKLVEKHARAAGIPDLKITWVTFGSGSALNDALLSGSLQIAVGGTPSLITLWSKTRGGMGVRGIASMSAIPMYLNSSNPAVKTIADFTEKDKIALPGVKISVHAVTLEMAAAKMWGPANYAKLDPQTVTLSHPEGMAAMLSGISEITAHFTSPPYQNEELKKPGIHRVLSSYDVLGGQHSFSVAWTTAKFHDQNPKLYKAFLDALQESIAMIANDKQDAARGYLQISKDKISQAEVVQLLDEPDIAFTTTPQRTMQYADFMYSVHTIPLKPNSWKDLFFPEIQGAPGS